MMKDETTEGAETRKTNIAYDRSQKNENKNEKKANNMNKENNMSTADVSLLR